MLETKVEAFLNQQLFPLTDKEIVIGVSGGPDSLALLHYLHTVKEKRNLSLVVAHVDHMFRGQESYEDALFVKTMCETYSLPFEMERINVPERIEATGMGSQIAAREARYEFYLRIMEKYHYSYLALGHHGDDQVETMLMRLTRGSSGMARAGIPFTRPFHNGTIFRPFLCLTKNEIQQYCENHKLSPRIDPSNEKDIYSRNRFRRHVLPFLKAENPQVHEQFQRFSEELQSDETFLQELTAERMNKVMIVRNESQITIDMKRFLEMPLPLQRRGIQLILNYLYKENPASLSAVHIDQVFSLIHHSKPSGHLDFPNGLKVVRSYHQLSFQFELKASESFSFEINEPGIIMLPNGASITIEYVNGEIPETNRNVALFHEDRIKWPMIVRTRRQGDRMTLKGMQGSKKLKDIFIDQKIPMEERDIWPVIMDKDGCIIWLPGLKKSSLEGLDDSAKQSILLTYSTQ